MNQTPSSNWLAYHQPFSYKLQGTPDDVSQAMMGLNEEGGCINGYVQSIQLMDARAGYYFTFTIRRRNRIFYTTAQAEGSISASDSGEVVVEGFAHINGEAIGVIIALMAVAAVVASLSAKVSLVPCAIMAAIVAIVWIGLLYYDRSTALSGIEEAMSRVDYFSQTRKDHDGAKQKAAAYWKDVEQRKKQAP